jgi:hypothetical protein
MKKQNFTAQATASSSAQTSTTPPSLVTSTATATATSKVSYKNAYKNALQIAEKNSQSSATNDANIITQAVNLAKKTITSGTGPQGNLGAQGPQGINGTIGFTGPQGSPGLPGYSTNTGATGSQGFTGPQGNVGAQGPQGVNGTIGFTGPQGNVGPQGSQGVNGTIGFTGPQGLPGYAANTGATGYTGAKGSTGSIGSQGPQGFTGSIGPQGPPGIGGGSGSSSTGPQGAPGVAGSTGAPGAAGSTGPQGPAGSGGGSNSGTTTFGFEVIYSVTTNAVVGQAITTDNYTQIYSINPLSGFPSLPSNISVNFTNVAQSATVHKSFIIFTNNAVTTSTTPTNLQYLVWPVICYTSPLSIASSASAASISNPALMLYSNTNVVSKPSFQGPYVSPSNTGANSPIVGATNTTIYLDLTFKNSVNLGGNLSNYLIQTGDNIGNVTFLGTFIYITFNNAILNI